MARKIIGIILILMAIGLTIWINVNIGNLIPHIIGPIILAVIGATLLAFKKKIDPYSKLCSLSPFFSSSIVFLIDEEAA